MTILKNGSIDCVILCGGAGTRLGKLTQTTPKPLLPFGDVPFLVFLLKHLQKEGFENFILAAHHLADQFYSFAKEFRFCFPKITVIEEPKPLGTGGALRHAAERVRSGVFVALNGDSLVTQPLTPVLKHHAERRNLFTLVAVRKEKVEGESRNKGGLIIGPRGECLSFSGHKTVDETWVNAGVYVADRQKILSWPLGFYNLENTLESLLRPDKATIFKSEGALLDIGTPNSLELAREKYETDSLLFGGRHH